MIAPTNCNPYCDCAQRLVRCQKASAKSPAELDFVEKHIAALDETLVRDNVFLDRPPPYVIPASLAPAIAPEDIQDITFELEQAMATDVVIGADGVVYRADYSDIEDALEELEATEKAARLLEGLEEIEKEFPATMGVKLHEFTPEENAAFDAADAKMRETLPQGKWREPTPFIAKESNTGPMEVTITDQNGSALGTVSAQYPGAMGPWMLVGYDRTILRQNLIKAFRECDLDCGCWSPDALEQLADIAIDTLEKAA